MNVLEPLREVWLRAFGAQPAPESATVVGAGLVAVLLVVLPQAWRYTRHLVTIAHEGSHGLAALAGGRRLSGIRVHSDTSGLTVSRGRNSGPGMVVTAAAGYVGPSLIGLGASYLVGIGHAVGVLWLAVLLLVLLLLQIRNFFGLYAVLLVGAATFVISWWGSGSLQAVVACTGTWFLLLAAPRTVLEMQSHRWRSGSRTTDADVLARLTGLPGLVWVGFFVAATVSALVLGGSWLIPD